MKTVQHTKMQSCKMILGFVIGKSILNKLFCKFHKMENIFFFIMLIHIRSTLQLEDFDFFYFHLSDSF